MKYLAAYALAWLGGKNSPTVKDLEAIVKAAGGEFEADKANTLVEALKDKPVHELIAAGRTKLSGVSTGGASAAVASNKSAAVESKEEKKDEKGDDEDAAMEGGMGLFGDDDGW